MSNKKLQSFIQNCMQQECSESAGELYKSGQQQDTNKKQIFPLVNPNISRWSVGQLLGAPGDL